MAVALVGLPGAGKSAVGRRLAQRLQLPFIDSDDLIERRIGCSIRDYFEREGEQSFRDLEQTVITELAASAQGIVSTGGGSVLREANRVQLHTNFHVIYLRSSPEDLFRRLRHDVKRPLLQVADPLGRLHELYSARDPLYREAAHDVVETGRPSVAMLVNIIVMQLELAGLIPPGSQSDPPG
ncbi:shikimate kinase [Variovorax sp. WS11]|uniref:shikimate kinase n=1 Tax=Variovorax sp. WS11 TaxID=1105204 RepID=UPI000D0DD551|nr:shikimate kinase [Variovorax sp. WS11]NDZ15095.1 shikimate kinase [Variovorax sp. WS11]PSL85503.1 shikimate kinase [Variovorax sp. WS11]